MTEAMKLVPVVPTDEMLDAADGPFHRTVADMRAANKRMGHQVDAMASEPFAKVVWQAMLQASPIDAGDRGEELHRVEAIARCFGPGMVARDFEHGRLTGDDILSLVAQVRHLQALLPPQGSGEGGE